MRIFLDHIIKFCQGPMSTRKMWAMAVIELVPVMAYAIVTPQGQAILGQALIPQLNAFALGAALAALFAFTDPLVDRLAEQYGLQLANSLKFAPISARWAAVWEAGLRALAAGLPEELMIRGVIQNAYGIWIASIIFGMAHVQSLKGLPSGFCTFVAGLLYGLVYICTGCLWAPITAHVLYNFRSQLRRRSRNQEMNDKEFKMLALLKRGIQSVVHPVVRLQVDPHFPLTGKRLGKTYATAFAIFIVCSFLPVIIFLAVYHVLKFADPDLAVKIHTALTESDLRTPTQSFQTAIIVTTFCTGFGAQTWYIARALRRSRKSLHVVLGLTTRSLRGRNGLETAWAIVWRAAIAMALWTCVAYVLGLVLPPVHQDTTDWISKLSGGNLYLIFMFNATLVPVFEEIIFRGLVFQTLRTTFHEWMNNSRGANIADMPGRWVVDTPARADFAAVVCSAAVFALEHMQFNPSTLLMLFLAGCWLAEVFRRTGTLWTSILVHGYINAMIAIILT